MCTRFEAPDLKTNYVAVCSDHVIELEPQKDTIEALSPDLNCVDVSKEIAVDVTPIFVTNEVFTSRYSLVDWYQTLGRGIQTIVVTMKFDKG